LTLISCVTLIFPVRLRHRYPHLHAIFISEGFSVYLWKTLKNSRKGSLTSQNSTTKQTTATDLEKFGDAGSATGSFGDGGRKCLIRKKCVLEILQKLDYKSYLLTVNPKP